MRNPCSAALAEPLHPLLGISHTVYEAKVILSLGVSLLSGLAELVLRLSVTLLGGLAELFEVLGVSGSRLRTDILS